MLNRFTKKMPWLVASLLVATTIFGEAKEIAADNCRPKPVCPEQKPCPPCPPQKCPPKCCEPVPEVKLIPAYNAPARIDVRGCWDLYVGASFIYWEAMQDDMEFAVSASSSASAPLSSTVGNKSTAAVIGHDFSYQPGFKILAGMNFDHDHWEGFAEYTWFKSNTSTTVTAETPVAGTVTNSTAVYTTQNHPALVQNNGFASSSQNWRLSYQALNTVLARSYYVGTKLTFRSIFGPRFAWFSQRKLINSVGAANGDALSHADEKQSFSSWGAGLVGGLDTNWMIGEGFRLIGNGSFDILYTRVQTTNSKYSTIATATPTQQTIIAFPEARPDFLMPHANIEFGFGWGSYFDCNNWHIDLSATYSFQTFWGANLFRHSNDDVQIANGQLSKGNLDIHGLTTSFRLDF